jgi:hypothetical protein
MQNMHTRTSVSFVLLQQGNKGTCVLFLSLHRSWFQISIVKTVKAELCRTRFIDSDPELKSAFGDSRRPDEHPVLAVGLLQFLWCQWPRENAHLTRMVCMPNQEDAIKANVTLDGVGFLQTQCVQQCPVLFIKS